MYPYRSGGATHARRGQLAAGWILLLCSPAVSAQETRIVSSQIEISANAASLHLELAGGDAVDIRFAGGVATLNGDPLGEYEPGGPVDGAWRDLLAGVYPLSGAPLARELAAWRPDPGLEDSGLALLARVDEVLDETLEDARPVVAQNEPAVPRTRGDPSALLAMDADLLRVLAAATEDIEFAGNELRIGEDHSVPAGTTVEGNVVLVDGHLEVAGHVRGAVIVLNGALTLADGSQVDGDVRLMNTDFEDHGGSVHGRWVNLADQQREREEIRRAALRDEILREVAQGARVAPQSRQPSMFMFRVRQVADMLLGMTVTFLVLGFLTFLLTVFGGHRVRAVVGEVANNPLGSTLAGFAGAYAVLPVFILVCAALAVTIIGIPVLLVWIPLFPLALALAGLAGFVGVAENVGKWVLRHDLSWLRWVDDSNTYFVRLVGIGVFLLPLLFGGIVAQVPFIDFVGEVVGVAGLVGWAAALIIGFGAVIITRGGSRGAHWSNGFGDDAFGSAHWPDAPVPDAPETGAPTPPAGEDAGSGGAGSSRSR